MKPMLAVLSYEVSIRGATTTLVVEVRFDNCCGESYLISGMQEGHKPETLCQSREPRVHENIC